MYCYEFAKKGKCEKFEKGECQFTKEQHITDAEAKKRAKGKVRPKPKGKAKGKPKGKGGKATVLVGEAGEDINEVAEALGIDSDGEDEQTEADGQ